MVWGSKGRPANQTGDRVLARDRVDHRGGERLAIAEWRQQARDRSSQQCLASSRRPHQQQPVAAG